MEVLLDHSFSDRTLMEKCIWTWLTMRLYRFTEITLSGIFQKMPLPQFTPQQRAYMVTEFHRTQSPLAVLRGFCLEFLCARSPSQATIYKNVCKYQDTLTNHNLNKSCSSRPRTARTQQNQNIQVVEGCSSSG